jgi:hypothetical protein
MRSTFTGTRSRSPKDGFCRPPVHGGHHRHRPVSATTILTADNPGRWTVHDTSIAHDERRAPWRNDDVISTRRLFDDAWPVKQAHAEA